jgi:hypothetical protein
VLRQAVDAETKPDCGCTWSGRPAARAGFGWPAPSPRRPCGTSGCHRLGVGASPPGRRWSCFKEGREAESVELARQALRDGDKHADPLAIGYARHALSQLSGERGALAHIEEGLAVLGDGPESMELRSLLL